MVVQLAVTVKHFIRLAPPRMTTNGLQPEQIKYDYDKCFLFFYDGEMVYISGSPWQKKCTPDEVADTIKSFFAGTNYHLANIEEYR
jgi:hypothetical protein